MSSRRRFAEYVERRRTLDSEATDGKAAPGGGGGSTPPDGRPKRKRTFVALFGEFWGMLAGHGRRLTLVLALTTLTIATAIALVMPASTKVTIDYILSENPGPAGIPAWLGLPRDRVALLWIVAGAMIAAAVASMLVGTWGRWQITRLTKRMQASMRREVFDHAVRLPLHRVYQLKSGGAASILRDDAGQAGELLFSMIYNPWRAIVQLVGTLAILASVDWRMLVGAMILIPAVWVTHQTWISRIRPMHRDTRAVRQVIDSHSTETFGGMRVVRGFNRETGESGRFTRGHHYMARQEVRIWWWSRIIEMVWGLLIPLASVGVLVYGGTRVIEGSLTIGDVMMFSAYLLMLLGPLETLTATATGIQNNLAGFDRVLDVLQEPREFHETVGNVTVGRETAQGRITLDDVTFTYSGSAEPVIRGVSLDVRPGELIAFVGPSGSGKTTLCNLIARFYDPSSGSVLFDGVDLREIDVNSYRRLLGIVEQDVFLFDGSVAANISYARRDATKEEIEEAAAAANADGFIRKLERGYETLIGERGVRLSGGQKQRIAIARALLADPLVLILDEATSNLDSESEALIQRSLSKLLRGRTSFVIAHRLSTIRHADRIVVLEDGRIIEVGTHDELLASGGRYAKFLRMQVEGNDEVAEVERVG